MTAASFQRLYDDVCDVIHAPRFALGHGIEGPVAFHVIRQGVVANILHFPQTCEDHAFILVDFGSIPYQDPRAARVLLALLDVNFLLPQAHPPALGRNPVTGEVTMRVVFPLAEATAAKLLEVIDHGVAMALDWRQTYFLKDDEEETALEAATREGVNAGLGSFV